MPTATEAAKALVGQYVPLKLVANICDADQATHAKAHTVNIKSYKAFIVEPLEIKALELDNFTDATNEGSTISVAKANEYPCWNADASGTKYIAALDGDADHKAMWYYYQCESPVWMTDQIKTNLKVDDNGNLVPVEGYKEGKLPTNTSVTYDAAKQELTYHNYSGTPVNEDYTIYIPVKYSYKWKTVTIPHTIVVKKNAGTPTGE